MAVGVLVPTPKEARPSETRSSVAAVIARTAGVREKTFTIAVPISTSSVRAAISESLTTESVSVEIDVTERPASGDEVSARVNSDSALEHAADHQVDEVAIDFDRDPDEIRAAWKTLFQVLVADIVRQLDDAYGVDLLEDHASEIDSLVGSIVEAGRDRSVLEYKQADAVRTDVYADISAVFDASELLVTPTLAVPPFEAEKLGPSDVDGTEIDPFIDWILSWIFNMTDHPAASIPAGFVNGSLPVGMQLVGDRFADDDVLAASVAFERRRPWHDAYPGLN